MPIAQDPRLKTFRTGYVVAMVLIVGCLTMRVRPVAPTHSVRAFPKPRTLVFDAALATAHDMNLDVKVLERESGLIRFETAVLRTDKLDYYCVYPLEYSGCGIPPRNFETATRRGLSCSCLLSMTVLIEEESEGLSIVDVRANGTATLASGAYTSTNPTQSTEALEREFLQSLGNELGFSPTSAGAS